MNVFEYETSIGKIALYQKQDELIRLTLNSALKNGFEVAETPLMREADRQLSEYLEGKREGFSLPLNPYGTPFTKKVWQEMSDVDYGTTINYHELAVRVHAPYAHRAVLVAVTQNPLPIIIPCHRITGADCALCAFPQGKEIIAKLRQIESFY